MRKGGWKRRAWWAVGLLLGLALLLAFTARHWIPPAARALLATRGVRVETIAWEGTNSLKLQDLEIKRPGADVRISSLTTLTPTAWKRALRNAGTNEPPVFLTVSGWKVIPKNAERSAGNPLLSRQITDFQAQMERFRANCPRAVFLNGIVQHSSGEFRFGAVEWKEGELAGDFTWPGLNDPADFKLTRTNLIVRQIGLEIGSRIAIETSGNNARLAGYARWTTNRADFDLTFGEADNFPLHGALRSSGLAIPGKFIGLPEVERLNAGVSLAITNGQFRVRVSEIDQGVLP